MKSMKYLKYSVMVAGLALFAGCSKDNKAPGGITEPLQPEQSAIYPKPTPAKSSSETGYTGWVGDVMPYYFNDQFQIFFLHDAIDQVKQTSKGQHPIHRFTTKDLLTFNYEGEAVAYGTADRQDQLLGTGSVVKMNSTYYCYYTGHNSNAAWTATNPREAVMYATSSDLKTWTKKSAFKLTAPVGYSNTDFRDPSVFYNEEFNEYWMMVSTQKAGKAVLLVFTTKDLAADDWAIRGTLPVNNSNYLMMECAEIFKAGGKYYLLFAEDWSNSPGTRYRVANSTAGPWEMPAGGNDMFDGHQFYAGRSVSDGVSRYTMGWVHRRNPEANTGTLTWGGNLVTHELYPLSNGDLAVKIPASVANYFNNEADAKVKNVAGGATQTVGNFTLTGTGAVVRFTTTDKTVMVKGNIQLSQLDGSFNIGLNATENNTGSYMIKLEPKNNRIAAYNDALEVTHVPFNFIAGKAYAFKLVMENSVAVLYIDDKVALTNRIYGLTNNLWTIATDGLNVSVNNLKVATHQ